MKISVKDPVQVLSFLSVAFLVLAPTACGPTHVMSNTHATVAQCVDPVNVCAFQVAQNAEGPLLELTVPAASTTTYQVSICDTMSSPTQCASTQFMYEIECDAGTTTCTNISEGNNATITSTISGNSRLISIQTGDGSQPSGTTYQAQAASSNASTLTAEVK